MDGFVVKEPVRTGTSDQPMSIAFLQIVTATSQLLYPMPKISDPAISKWESVAETSGRYQKLTKKIFDE